MGQPNPPGDLPLIEGLDPSWNEFVSAIPEDKRAELGPKFKERVTSLTSEYEPLKQYSDLHKSGISAEQADVALRLMATIENDPKSVYETIGQHLGITPGEAKKVVEEVKKEAASGDDPRFQTLQEQVETMAKVLLTERELGLKEQRIAEQTAAWDKEFGALKQKYGDNIPEDEIVMRVLHKDMSAEDAYNEWSSRVSDYRRTRPAPILLGAGGNVPTRAGIDPTKLNSQDTRKLVAQMMEHGNNEMKK